MSGPTTTEGGSVHSGRPGDLSYGFVRLNGAANEVHSANNVEAPLGCATARSVVLRALSQSSPSVGKWSCIHGSNPAILVECNYGHSTLTAYNNAYGE